MAFNIGIRFKALGVPEIYRKLYELDRKLARKAMRKAITEVDKLILRDARSKVREQTKTLKKSLGSKVKSYKGGLVIVGMTGPRKDARGKPAKFRRQVKVKTGRGTRMEWRNPVFYAHLVEQGTRPHTLGGGSELTRLKAKKRKRVQHGTMHPGTKPQPFLRPALERNRSAIPEIIARYLNEAIKTLAKG
ncbi:HK97-gp10 family putative phage morphogenesis protein [Zavarzinella formosa]|uniref:HK97-gp10 family putative phage morphogenesis protein n=1 Tax=Zavarzinella formosa TaxID=360055 RepID=UPI000318884A|nr:HK97-gp10 family putative phage morphogenesis protein [Zavarzinella formosa]